MKIALVSLQFEETATGGGGVHVKDICDRFLSSGQDVTVISIHTEKTLSGVQLREWEVPYSVQERGKLSIVRFLIDEGLQQPYEGEKDVELDRIMRFADTVIKWIRTRPVEFDVINLHGHHILPGVMAEQLRGRQEKIVSTIHALESTYISQKGESLGSFEATPKILEKLRTWESMIRFADFVVVNSPTVLDEFKKIIEMQGADVREFEDRIKLVSSGCGEGFLMNDEDVRRKLSQIPEVINLGTFCRIDPSKGIEFSINGAKSAARLSDHKFCLTIAGIPDSDEYVNRLTAESQGIPDNLEIKFKIFNAISPVEERKDILDPSHIYILPTLKEPFGMSIIEASARGNMVVSSETNGPQYMFESDSGQEQDWGIVTGYGVLAKITRDHNANFANNIARGIVWTVENWQECVSHVLKFNKKIRSNWTWESIAEQYLELFRN